MCGICGMAYRDPARQPDRTVLGAMSAVIRHRGPDSAGFHAGPGVGLGARRLAIIDVACGDQPVANEDGTVHVVFNGEIYNHELLRTELQRRGHHFRTHVDTEVIVHLYEELGAGCVTRLRGMFAFALWDARSHTLLLARDRVGKKPLYYAEHDGALLFGSELKCLLQYPGFRPVPDTAALHHYLSLQYVPDPLSAFAGVRKLPPAHWLSWTLGDVRTQRYWDLDFQQKQRISYAAAREQVRDAVVEAVRVRLMSEVPFGAHLSGGIDSAVVVAVMAGLLDQPVRTFSIGFRERAYDETPWARSVARRYGTEHHDIIVEPSALDVLPALIEHFDEPFADPAAIPLWYLARFTRQHVTVALNGDGGDEAFAGYQRYYADPIADAYRAIPRVLRRTLLDPALRAIPYRADVPLERSYVGALRLLTSAARTSHGASVLRWGSYFDEADKRALFRPEILASFEAPPSAALLEATFEAAPAHSRLDRTLYTDLHHYLPGALLVKADRMSMAHSLEARSPLLDHHVIELAATLPSSYKLRGLRTKRVLRDAFADLLPPGIGTRPKMGFGVPLAAWFRGALREPARDLLTGADTRIGEYLLPDRVTTVLDEHVSGRLDHGKRLWALLNLEMWLRRFLVIRN
jgi:asparagine synthase (glutamine-hydrolysing)